MGEQVHYFICEHTCFPRTGSGYYKLRASEIFHRLTLLRIQLRQIIFHASDEFVEVRIVDVTDGGEFRFNLVGIDVEVIAQRRVNCNGRAALCL